MPAHLDLASEQQILRVTNNRGACCHVAGDIDFDKHNNLWIATGDDTPAGGGNSGGFSPFNDMKTDEAQTVRVDNATGGTFTLTFNGQTTSPLAFNSTAAQIVVRAAGAEQRRRRQRHGHRRAVNTANVTVTFRGALSQADQPQMTGDATGLTGTTPTAGDQHDDAGGSVSAPHVDARRSALNTNDLRGKLLRINVKDGDIAPADANHADFGAGGAYTIPSGNLFPLVAGGPQAKTRPEIYAMGFRNPFRVQVDENDVAYVSDYSPDSQTPQQFRGPAGTGRYEIVRHAGQLRLAALLQDRPPYYRWNFNTSQPLTRRRRRSTAPPRRSRTTRTGTSRAGRRSSRPAGPGAADHRAGHLVLVPGQQRGDPLGTPCFGNYGPNALTDPPAPGSTTPCPRLFPELFTGGVGPHGIAKYHYDPANPNPKKFPPYYDDSVILGEFTQDTLREIKLDSQNRVFKINSFLNCGQFGTRSPTSPFECDNPMDMQWGSDGSFYLLTYGDGVLQHQPRRGHVQVGVRQGHAGTRGRAHDRQDRRPVAADGQLLERRLERRRPWRLDPFEWDFGDGTAHSIDPNPSHTYTARGRYTAVLTVTDSSGKSTSTSTIITAGNTSPTVVVNTPVDGGTFAFGDNIPFTVTVTDPEDGPIICAEVAGHVRARPRLARPRRDDA